MKITVLPFLFFASIFSFPHTTKAFLPALLALPTVAELVLSGVSLMTYSSTSGGKPSLKSVYSTNGGKYYTVAIPRGNFKRLSKAGLFVTGGASLLALLGFSSSVVSTCSDYKITPTYTYLRTNLLSASAIKTIFLPQTNYYVHGDLQACMSQTNVLAQPILGLDGTILNPSNGLPLTVRVYQPTKIDLQVDTSFIGTASFICTCFARIPTVRTASENFSNFLSDRKTQPVNNTKISNVVLDQTLKDWAAYDPKSLLGIKIEATKPIDSIRVNPDGTNADIIVKPNGDIFSGSVSIVKGSANYVPPSVVSSPSAVAGNSLNNPSAAPSSTAINGVNDIFTISPAGEMILNGLVQNSSSLVYYDAAGQPNFISKTSSGTIYDAVTGNVLYTPSGVPTVSSPSNPLTSLSSPPLLNTISPTLPVTPPSTAATSNPLQLKKLDPFALSGLQLAVDKLTSQNKSDATAAAQSASEQLLRADETNKLLGDLIASTNDPYAASRDAKQVSDAVLAANLATKTKGLGSPQYMGFASFSKSLANAPIISGIGSSLDMPTVSGYPFWDIGLDTVIVGQRFKFNYRLDTADYAAFFSMIKGVFLLLCSFFAFRRVFG